MARVGASGQQLQKALPVWGTDCYYALMLCQLRGKPYRVSTDKSLLTIAEEVKIKQTTNQRIGMAANNHLKTDCRSYLKQRWSRSRFRD